MEQVHYMQLLIFKNKQKNQYKFKSPYYNNAES